MSAPTPKTLLCESFANGDMWTQQTKSEITDWLSDK